MEKKELEVFGKKILGRQFVFVRISKEEYDNNDKQIAIIEGCKKVFINKIIITILPNQLSKTDFDRRFVHSDWMDTATVSEILKLREQQDEEAEIFFSMWLESIDSNKNCN